MRGILAQSNLHSLVVRVGSHIHLCDIRITLIESTGIVIAGRVGISRKVGGLISGWSEMWVPWEAT